MFRFNNEYENQIISRWNKKVRSMRIIGGLVGLLMIIGAILLIVYPFESVNMIGKVIGFVFWILGIYRIVDYLVTPSYLRYPGNLLMSCLYLLIGLVFLTSPLVMTMNTVAWILALVLLVYGINRLMFTHRLNGFGVNNYGWVSISGILSVILAIIFLIAPMLLTLIINYVAAGYLVFSGLMLLVEALSMKDLRI